MSGKILGIDVSRWQGQIDWNTAARAGYTFAVLRATSGNYYTDPTFYINWRDASEAGLALSAYHVVVPGIPARAQIDRFLSVLDGRQAAFPLVLDVEMDKTRDKKPVTAAQLTPLVAECAQLIAALDGRNPIIYTGVWFWNSKIQRSNTWSQYDLWVASYGGSQPALPADWQEWCFWQTTNEGKVPGVTSKFTDLDEFNGSEEAFAQYLSQPANKSSISAKPAPPPKPASPRLTGRIIAAQLNVRAGPGLNYDIVDTLNPGDKVEVFDVNGKDAWIKIGPDRWTAVTINGSLFLEIE